MPKSNNKVVCMVAMASYPGDPRVRRQAEALEQKGYEVDVLCRYSGDQPPKEKFGNVTAYRIMHAPPQENKVKYLLQSFIFVIVAFIKLLLLSFKRKYSIIQVHNLPDYLVFVGVLHKLFGAKLILDIHDPSVDLFEEKWPGKRNRIIKYFVKKAEKYSCKISDHLITVTNTCKERLVTRGNPSEKITLILNSANDNIFVFNDRRRFVEIKEGAKILYYGTIAQRFGLHNSVKAMQALLKDIPNSILNIYGRYEENYRKKLEKLITEFGLDENVKLNDKVTREQIPALINNHDIGVIPHLITNYSNLGLPTKAFEFITSGLPVIATKSKELYSIMMGNGITFVEKGSPEELSEAIKYLCLNPEVRKSRADLAYQSIKEISSEVMNKRYTDLIDKMVVSQN